MNTTTTLVSDPNATGVKSTMTVDKIESALNSRYRDDLAASLPAGIEPSGYARAMCAMIRAKSDVISCTPESLLTAILGAARSGLDPATGGFYFVKYGNECEFVLSYKGMLQLAREAGQIIDLFARVVREGDRFEWVQGATESIKHEPDPGIDRETRQITHVYAVAVLPSGRQLFECWDRSRLDAHVLKNVKSATSKSSPWQKDFEQMARKTLIKQFFSTGRLAMSAPINGAETEGATTDTAPQDADDLQGFTLPVPK